MRCLSDRNTTLVVPWSRDGKGHSGDATLVMIPGKEDIDLELGSREKRTDWEYIYEVEPDCLTKGR